MVWSQQHGTFATDYRNKQKHNWGRLARVMFAVCCDGSHPMKATPYLYCLLHTYIEVVCHGLDHRITWVDVPQYGGLSLSHKNH